jgi:hypothetical protein
MSQAALQKIHSHLTGLESVLAKSHGGWADEESLLEFRRLCWETLLLIDEPECHEQIDLLVQYATRIIAGTSARCSAPTSCAARSAWCSPRSARGWTASSATASAGAI